MTVYLVPDLFAYGLQKASLRQLGAVPVMASNLFPGWKRFFDVFFSLIVLLAASPFFVIMSSAHKDRGWGTGFLWA
jgi:lipopolysaccharide/colanic/teichoic acid biosynthesis glycosyltransferase